MEDNKPYQVNFLEVFFKLFQAIQKSIFPLLIINGVILAGGITYRLTTDLAYEGSVIVKSKYMEINYIKEFIEPINRHLKDKRPEGIARTLNIPLEMAMKCGGVSLTSIIDEEYVLKRKTMSSEDLTENERDNTFILTVSGANHEVLETYKEAVLAYLSAQPSVKSRQAFFVQERKSVVDYLESDIRSMDSIKSFYSTFGQKNSSQFSGLVVQDLGDFYYGGSMVYEKMIKFKFDMSFGAAFEELSTFEYYDKYASPRWTFVLIITALIGIFVSFAFLFWVEFRNYST